MNSPHRVTRALRRLSCVGLVLISPNILTGSGAEAAAAPTAIIAADPFFPLKSPSLISVPLGFLGCYLGTLLGGRGAERERQQGLQVSYEEIHVRSLTGISNVEQEIRKATSSQEPHAP